MLRRLVLMLAALVIALAGCADSEPAETKATPTPSSEFGTASVILPGDDGSVLLKVEVAETEEQRAKGLMFRESLPEDAGMLFVYFEETNSSFYMKNTLIPLSIAFFDENGKILRILDMDPCKREPCELYNPNVVYRGALEVNQGMFEEWGVKEGEVLEIVR